LYVHSTLIRPTTTEENKGIIFRKTWSEVIEDDKLDSDNDLLTNEYVSKWTKMGRYFYNLLEESESISF
jgi:hypothetical protein